MQLSRGITLALLLAPAVARADDAVDFTTTWYQEQRQGSQGGLTVIHPQLDVGIDAGEKVSLDAGYSADAVTGATASVYSVDAISTATPFSDLRHEGHLGLAFHGKRSTFGLGASLGTERDYAALAVTGSGAIDLPGRNTNVALSYTHSFDYVCDRDNADLAPLERRALTGADVCDKQGIYTDLTEAEQMMLTTVWRELSIDTTQATITQNLSPTTNMQLSLFGQVLHGFQSNPYRRVQIGPNQPQEHIPDVRGRVALAARFNRFLPGLKAAVHASARAYSDTWGVNSGTLEGAYSQYLGQSLLIRIRARAYAQTPATFFKDAFFYETESTAGEFFTGDRELAPVRNVLVGGKLTVLSTAEDDKDVWGLFDKVQLNIKADVLFLSEAPADDPDANLEGIDRQFLHSGQLLDGFMLAVGLLADY